MPVDLDMQITNLKELEREFKKDVRSIQRELTKETGKIARNLDKEIKNLVRAEMLSYGYKPSGVEEMLKGIRVYHIKGRGVNIYARIKVTFLGAGNWVNAHLGEHKERYTETGIPSYRGKLKPEALDLDGYVDREAPRLQEIAERITKRILELKTTRI